MDQQARRFRTRQAGIQPKEVKGKEEKCEIPPPAPAPLSVDTSHFCDGNAGASWDVRFDLLCTYGLRSSSLRLTLAT